MKKLLVNTITYHEMILTLSRDLYTTYRDIEKRLKAILKKEGVDEIDVDSKHDTDMFEFTEMPYEDCYTLVNSVAFINDYKEKILRGEY